MRPPSWLRDYFPRMIFFQARIMGGGGQHSIKPWQALAATIS